MIKTTTQLLLVFILLVSTNTIYSQATVAATINSLNLPCGGGQVDLTALGDASFPLFGDDFNTGGGGLLPGWSTNVNAQFDNPCGASVDNTPYLWMGSSAQAPRAITTPAVDVSCGGEVCFDYKNSIQAQSSPCEGMDQYNEGVGIQFSTNSGGSWTTFGYIAPNGDVLTTVPTSTSPSTSGTTVLTDWTYKCFTIPLAAYGTTTIFRLRQFNSSSASYDHWGIDNFTITSVPCNPYVYDWEHIPGTTDPQNTSANVTQTTTFTVHYTNGIDDAVASVTVVVADISLDNVSITSEACLGDNNASITATSTTVNGTAPFNYSLSGPTTGINNSGNFTGLNPGIYTLALTDATGCSDTYNFSISPGPSCCTVTAIGTNISCFGGTDGTATANPANGVAPYTYLWNDGSGQTTQTASGLTEGIYSVTITDASGCTSTASTTLTQSTVLNSAVTSSEVLCFGGDNSQIIVDLPTGGVGPYTYSINGGVYQASTNFNTLVAGNYTISVKDDMGCLFTITEVITEPADLTLSEASNISSTCGQSNGSLMVIAGGGTATYSYQLGATTNSTGLFIGLLAGNYVVTVTDDKGCTESLNIIIGDAAGPVPSLDASSNVACAGGLNGSATISANGGTPPYQYSKDFGVNYQASNTFALAAGNYTVTVRDANLCTGTVTFDIFEPAPLTFSTTSVDVLCNADCNGIVDVLITTPLAQQFPPYTYSSNNGTTFQTSSSLNGLCAGNINVVVKDNSGCLANVALPIGEPVVLTSNFTFVEPSCFGVCDGEIHVTPTSGGTMPYNYSIDNGANFNVLPDFINQCAGAFNIVVQDDHGCEVNMNNSIVTTPPQIQFNFVANNPSVCGANDGSFEITATNGTPNYVYSINGGSSTQPNGLFTNLFSGLYTLVTIDANGCMDSTFSALNDIEMTSAIDWTQDLTCFNENNGEVQSIVLTGGGVNVSYILSTLTSGYVSPAQSSGLFTNLPVGQHAITITNNNLCINVLQFDIFEPDTILFDVVGTDLSCPTGNGLANGTLTISNPTGGNGVGGGLGGPYEYSKDGGSTYQVSSVFNDLTSGTYSIYVKDGNGCEGQSTYTLTEPSPFDVVVNATNLTCNGNNTGFIQIVASGATSTYTYSLDGVINTTGIYPLLAANSLVNPDYEVIVTDANLCEYTTTQIITEPALLQASYVVDSVNCNSTCDGQIEVTAIGGVPNYLYSPDNGITYQTSNILLGLCTGNHDIRVKDDNNCLVDITLPIYEPLLLTFTLTSTPATCGENNASGTINVTTGTGTTPFQYSVSSNNGLTFSALQSAITVTGLTAADYLVKVTDGNGCELTEGVNLSSDPEPVLDLVVLVNPLCFGDNNGSIEVTASSGVGTYEYSVQPVGSVANFGNSNQVNNLIDGAYNVVIKDANGCRDSVTTILTQPAVLTVASTPTDLSCFENSTGQIELVSGGGTTPYQYSIDNGTMNQGAGTFSFIAEGNYNVLITDFNNCTVTDNVVLTEPDELTWVVFTIEDSLCFNEPTGSVIAVANGGTSATGFYNYQWSSAIAGPTEVQANNVFPGTYSVVVTDDQNCSLDSLNFVLVNPLPVQIDAITVTDVLCNGNCDGEIVITVPAQNPAIDKFSIDNGATYSTSNTFNLASGDNICAGNYDIIVKNTHGCTASFIATVAEPDVLLGGTPPTNNVCFDENVLILPQIPTGGTPNYTFNWTDSNGGIYNDMETFYQVITSLTTFTLNLVDDNGCQAGPYSYDVSPTTQLAVTPSGNVSICPGESVVIGLGTATGGQLFDFGSVLDYSYSWATGGVNDTLSTFEVTPVVDPTTYYLTVVDACFDTVTVNIDVSLYSDPMPIIDVVGVGCAPYDAMLVNPDNHVTNGGTSVWTLGDGTTVLDQDIINHTYSEAGIYDVTLSVTTLNGCSSSVDASATISVENNPVADFSFTPSNPTTDNQNIEFTNTSEDAENYNWTFEVNESSTEENPSYEFNASVLTTMNVCLTAESFNGCVNTTCENIIINEVLLFYIPNVFTPDGDSYNEIFKPIFRSGFDPYDYHLIIFNRWGEIMFESYDANFGWNGFYAGHLVNDGVYIWSVEFGVLLNDARESHTGHITIIK